jgi:hypothetical protein
MNPSDQNTNNKNFTNAASKKLAKSIGPQMPRSPHERLIYKAELITIALREHIKPTLAAGGYTDKPALRALISTLYLEAFAKAFDKDELLNLCTILHMEIMMETIEVDPFLRGQPDLLSGV